MARRKVLTDKMIASLSRPQQGRRVMADPELARHCLRIPFRGPIVSTVIIKQGGKQVWKVVGSIDDLGGIAAAREKARVLIRQIMSGEPPPALPQSVASVAQSWLERHVRKRGLKSEFELRRIVARYIVPHIGNVDFVRLRRSDIVHLLDKIEDNHGARQADCVHDTLRSIAGWVQSRDDSYRHPFVRGMRRVPAHVHQRSRTLSDEELCTVWQAADGAGIFGDIIKLLLLTGQRREKVYKLKHTDIDGDGVWTVPQATNEKGTGGRLRLSTTARAIIAAQPRHASSDLVFPHLFSGNAKRQFQQRTGVEFRLHDLRRQCRSMLSRIGVVHEVAEAILGHKAKGVVGIYDRYGYEPEKGIALERLDAAIRQIVNPPPSNVVPLHEVAS
jgi:integrase